MNPPSHPAVRILRALALLLGIAAFGFTVWLVVMESVWDRQNQTKSDPEDAFVNGSIGTELAPLVAFEVLPIIFPDEFQPLKSYFESHGKTLENPGDWIEQYGFIRQDKGLPVGFVLSHHRPGSGAGSPVPFVGLSCAACHSAEIQTDPEKPGKVLYGVGNPTMNLLAFSEAVRRVLVKRVDPENPESDYVLTWDRIVHARKDAKLPEAGIWDRIMTTLWIGAARGETEKYSKVIDTPYEAKQLFNPRFMMAGPARTQPFRSLVRVHLEFPGWSANDHAMDQGFSKIPVVFHQDEQYHGKWAQFDGSVSNLIARSSLAASTAGANVNNLAQPDLAAHIILAADYTKKPPVPTWDDVFPDHPRTEEQKKLAERGAVIYRNECYHCHGEPDGAGGWRWGKDDKNLFGEIIPIETLGTDPERIQFRHKNEIPKIVADKFRKPLDGEAPFKADFRKDHPLATFTVDDLRAPDGYYCGPISGAFLRAPYLHNASILTLAELIGLKPRRDKFYRGRNAYDIENIGFRSPDVPKSVNHQNPIPHDKHLYFLFDTSVRGNSNRGHLYPAWGPWAKQPAALTDAQRADLKALLEYLRGI